MATQCERCAQDNPEDARFCKGCGAPLSHAAPAGADPLINQLVLDRYAIKHLVGEGGMGRVYAAEQRVGTTTRRVAVKTLLAQLSADPQIVKRFYREAETIVRLSHPNIISFYDFGALADGTLVIVMEYVEGESLAQCLSRGPISTARADAILAQVCGALSEAHSLGIVHRDLKPDNILLTKRGGQSDFVKVLDFGIAKISAQEHSPSAATKLTQQGMIIGTPPYMSPEQFRGDTVDARSDIYSLGVIAYEMHTARLPFDAKTPWEWASKHLTAEPERLRVDPGSGVSERRAAAIRKSLAKSVEERPQTVEEFLASLREVQSVPTIAPSDAVLAPPTSLRAPAVPAAPTPMLQEEDLEPPKTLNTPILAVAALVLLGLGAIGWFSLAKKEPGVTAQASVPGLPIATVTNPETGLDSSPTGSKLPPLELDSQEHAGANARPSDRKARKEERPLSHGKHTEKVSAEKSIATAEHESPAAPDGPRKDVRVDLAPKPSSAEVTPVQPTGATSTAPEKPVAAVARPANTSPSIAAAKATSTPADLAERIGKGLSQAPERPDVAFAIYQGAANRYGRDHPALVPLASAIQQHGDRRVRKLVEDRLCAQAQALYRALASAGLQGRSRSAFTVACPAPR